MYMCNMWTVDAISGLKVRLTKVEFSVQMISPWTREINLMRKIAVVAGSSCFF